MHIFHKLFVFLSLRVFGLLSSSLLLFPQCFGRYVLRPSSGVCQTREPSWNFRQTPEEGQRTYRPKCCGNNNKDGDNSLKTLNDKNRQASSQKLRQVVCTWITTENYQVCIYPTPPSRAGCDTRSILKWSLTGWD